MNCRQYAREEEASALGKIKAKKKLQEQKLRMDYSRSSWLRHPQQGPSDRLSRH